MGIIARRSSAARKNSRKPKLLAGASGIALAIGCSLSSTALATDCLTLSSCEVSTDAELRQALIDANANPGAEMTIRLTGDIAMTASTTISTPAKLVTIDTNGHTLSGFDNPTAGGGNLSFSSSTPPSVAGPLTVRGTLIGGDSAPSSTSNGGNGLHLISTTAVFYGSATGGTGGNGTATGGAGTQVLGNASLENHGSITGGTALGGGGGTGAVVSSNGSLENYGTVTGGGAVNGGAGVILGSATTGGTLVNHGTIRGGTGSSNSGPAVAVFRLNNPIINTGVIESGGNAAAISTRSAAASLSIINSGTISSGNDAIVVTGTGAGASLNLELHTGSLIEGNVIGNAAATNTLTLGGSGTDSFDVSAIGPRYQNFDVFQKTGTGTWSLTGDGAATTDWHIQDGTLQIGDGGTSGSVVGDITTAASGTLAFNRSDAFTFDNLVFGDGTIRQVGSGTTTLTADNSAFAGNTTVKAGTLWVNGILGGTIHVLSGGRLQGTGQIGSTNNSGTIAPGNSIGTLAIDGDYAGSSGTLEIETVLGDDTSPTDLLVISGGTAGSTNVRVINLGGTGAQTVEGIKIIDVGDASNGSFALQGNYVYQGDQAVVGGAYAYRLYKNGVSNPIDGDWYLRSALILPNSPAPGPGPGEPAPPLYQAGVPLYEAYAGVLQTFNQLNTLQQRLGNRHWTVVAQGADGISDEMTAAPGIGIWGEIEGARAEFNPENTTGAEYNTTLWRLKAGFDTSLYEGESGNFIGGVAVHYGTVSADVSSIFGSGSIDTKGYGFSGTLTWYGNDGWYADAQAQATWYHSDLFSNTAGVGLTEGNNGFGYALGIEVGKRIPIDPEWAITPQAQLAWSAVDFDDFVDPFGAGVSPESGDSLVGRLGFAIDRQTEWQDAAGRTNRAHLYGIINLYYDFKDGSTVNVAGTPIRSENDGLWGGLGMGGTVDWAEGKYSLYGELMARTSLKDFGDSHVFTGTVGFRMKW